MIGIVEVLIISSVILFISMYLFKFSLGTYSITRLNMISVIFCFVVIGIIVGTYSSIFVATPIVRDLSKELKASQKASASNSFSKAAAKAK